MPGQRLIVTIKDNIEIIQLNRPLKRNAFDVEMYLELTDALNEAGSNDDISLAVLTGAGDYYSSGNDLNASALKFKDSDNFIEESKRVLRRFVEAFIDFPKILVAVVNGPAIGIAATTLALCDFVFASNQAFFFTPFTKLGLVGEGCSTITFPKILGKRKAAEMLFFNHKMTSEEALQYGFVNDVFHPDEIQSKVWNRIESFAQIPKDAILKSKKLIQDYEKNDLILANKREIDELANRWASKEFFDAIISFSQRKSKI